MPKKNGFLEHVLDLLTPAEGIKARAMFGGYGIYKNNIICGIIAYDTLYLKVTEKNIDDFKKAESAPFSYQKSTGKMVSMSYWEVPSNVMEDSELLLEWFDKAYKASLTAKTK